jgi:lipoprotein-anchoring transpeptidase ErfK/SrfK
MTRAMTLRPKTLRRGAAIAAGALLLLGIAVSLAPQAGAAPAAPLAQIQAIGSGTVAWPQVAVRAKPSESARRITILKEFRSGFRPQYVLAVAQVKNPQTGKPAWYRINLPGRPNGRTGWVRAESVQIKPVTKRLVIDRGARRFQFWDGKRLVHAGKVAVGKPGAETPLGLFYVQSKFVPNAPILGARAFETSAYSRLTDWPGGGVVGVHGTPWPELLGGAVSHGCIRLHNDDVRFLFSRVPLGTPVKIVA